MLINVLGIISIIICKENIVSMDCVAYVKNVFFDPKVLIIGEKTMLSQVCHDL